MILLSGALAAVARRIWQQSARTHPLMVLLSIATPESTHSVSKQTAQTECWVVPSPTALMYTAGSPSRNPLAKRHNSDRKKLPERVFETHKPDFSPKERETPTFVHMRTDTGAGFRRPSWLSAENQSVGAINHVTIGSSPFPTKLSDIIRPPSLPYTLTPE